MLINWRLKSSFVYETGKIVSSHLFYTFANTVFLIVSYNVSPNPAQVLDMWSFTSSRFWCSMLGYSLYFCALSMFVWMSLLSFDFHRTFKNMRMPNRQKSNYTSCLFMFVLDNSFLSLSLCLLISHSVFLFPVSLCLSVSMFLCLFVSLC